MQVLLSQRENSNSSLRLPQVVVDADEGLNCSLRAALVLVLLVVQRLSKGMALLCQGTKRPGETQQGKSLLLQKAVQ